MNLDGLIVAILSTVGVLLAGSLMVPGARRGASKRAVLLLAVGIIGFCFVLLRG